MTAVDAGARRALLLVSALTAVACRDPTEVTLDLRTDLQCDDTLRTTVAFGKLGLDLETRPVTVDERRCIGQGEIGTVVAVPSGSDDESFAVKVVTTQNGVEPDTCIDDPGTLPPDCVIQRRTFQFVPHESTSERIDMLDRCLGVGCGDAQTCGPTGECEDVK